MRKCRPSFQGKPLHINALNLPIDSSRSKPRRHGVAEVLQNNVDAIRMAGGVPHINHPNFGWAITPDELRALRNNKLFEVYDGHPMVINAGGYGHPSLERAWDALLSPRVVLFGLATDDAHHFKARRPLVVRPGMGWVMVRAEKLEAKAIAAAINRGGSMRRRASNLPPTRDGHRGYAEGEATSVGTQPSDNMWAGYPSRSSARAGRCLQEVEGIDATYTVKGTEGYVRARVTQSDGKTRLDATGDDRRPSLTPSVSGRRLHGGSLRGSLTSCRACVGE